MIDIMCRIVGSRLLAANSQSGPRGPVPAIIQKELYENAGFGAFLGKKFSKAALKDGSGNQALQSIECCT